MRRAKALSWIFTNSYLCFIHNSKVLLPFTNPTKKVLISQVSVPNITPHYIFPHSRITVPPLATTASIQGDGIENIQNSTTDNPININKKGEGDNMAIRKKGTSEEEKSSTRGRLRKGSTTTSTAKKKGSTTTKQKGKATRSKQETETSVTKSKGGRATRSGEKRGQSGKSAEELVEDVEIMAEKSGIQLPKSKKKKDEEVKKAIKKTSDKPYRDYSKQQALQELKAEHPVEKKKKSKEGGDAFANAPRRSPRQKRGVNAPPSEEEKRKPPAKRKTKSGGPSARSKIANEENRPLADALYELAEFVLHGDTVQKGLSYQKAAKSVRESPNPIKSKKEAIKLVGVGRSVADKIQEFLDKGKIQVLEEYREGERGM